jgi:hypothetical protein
MAGPEPRTAKETQPSGVEGEGLDPYPTYRDGPAIPHRATSTKPTDVELPRSRRTNSGPMLVGLIVFALAIIGLIVWASVRTTDISDEGLTPPETPPAAEAAATPDAAPLRENEADASAGPGEVDAAPGPADVPGGETTTPVEPEPAE